MIPIKTASEIESMREACRIAASVLAAMKAQVRAGVSTYELDQLARDLMMEEGASSACHNYQVGRKRFPSYTCISVNEEVVHAIASQKRVLERGDIVTLDVTIVHRGWIGDNACTVAVGDIEPGVERLVRVTEEAMFEGIAAARPGNRVRDISHAIQRYVETRGLSVVRKFVGHGVGRSMHEEPQIPNFVERGARSPELAPGMTLAIEPMVNLGRPDVEVLADGWTVVTRDRRPSAHFEHTVLITPGGPEILTVPTPHTVAAGKVSPGPPPEFTTIDSSLSHSKPCHDFSA
jgi:methionyl aminopeptidase